MKKEAKAIADQYISEITAKPSSADTAEKAAQIQEAIDKAKDVAITKIANIKPIGIVPTPIDPFVPSPEYVPNGDITLTPDKEVKNGLKSKRVGMIPKTGESTTPPFSLVALGFAILGLGILLKKRMMEENK